MKACLAWTIWLTWEALSSLSSSSSLFMMMLLLLLSMLLSLSLSLSMSMSLLLSLLPLSLVAVVPPLCCSPRNAGLCLCVPIQPSSGQPKPPTLSQLTQPGPAPSSFILVGPLRECRYPLSGRALVEWQAKASSFPSHLVFALPLINQPHRSHRTLPACFVRSDTIKTTSSPTSNSHLSVS
jgi:hypothetical protein